MSRGRWRGGRRRGRRPLGAPGGPDRASRGFAARSRVRIRGRGGESFSKILLASPSEFPYSTSSHGGVAQLGERLTGSQEVRGSIPLVSTIVNARPPGIRWPFSYSSTPQTKVTLASTRKKLRNYLPGFVQSLLAKHNSLCNSRRQQYNSGSARQPTHPHKPAVMYARRLDIPHNHGK